MSSEPTYSDDTEICEDCGMSIEEDGRKCAALHDGRCRAYDPDTGCLRE